MQLCTKVVHGKSWRHRTRLVLHGGVRWHFPAPEVDAEILVPYARMKSLRLQNVIFRATLRHVDAKIWAENIFKASTQI